MSVSALVAKIRSAMGRAFPSRVAVLGQISNLTRAESGHLYFRLKDGESALDAVMFRPQASRLKFAPEDGLEVVAEGHVDVYAVRGHLQLRVERLGPRGTGALELAFRQLQDKLRGEGLFDEKHKKAIPRFPRAIGVVTSPAGAAIRDIRRTLRRRWPAARVYLLGVPVQGEAAAGQIAEAVRLLDAGAGRYEIDTIIVSRGGGSLEDLWAFNEEPVARAIFAASTPIICGVGHEVDTTIADMVADVRAATPTAAAELAAPDRTAVARALSDMAGGMARTVSDRIASARAAVASAMRSGVFRDPLWRVRTQAQRVDELSARLGAALHPARLKERFAGRLADAAHRLRWGLGERSKRAGDRLQSVRARLLAGHPRNCLPLARQKVSAAGRQLKAMSHRAVLKRGFSVTRSQAGGILRSAREAKTGERVETELADGRFLSRVEQTGRETPD